MITPQARSGGALRARRVLRSAGYFTRPYVSSKRTMSSSPR